MGSSDSLDCFSPVAHIGREESRFAVHPLQALVISATQQAGPERSSMIDKTSSLTADPATTSFCPVLRIDTIECSCRAYPKDSIAVFKDAC